MGRSQSFFDLFTYGGAYSYHNVRVSGDTGASGQNLWAYTAQFGNGFSGTLSLEDPATRKGAARSTWQRCGFFDLNGCDRQRQRLDDQQRRQASASGSLTSSPTCALIRPGALPASARLCMTPAAPIRCNTAVANACAVTGNCVNNGHPEDKYGWALAGGAKFNLAGGDMIGFNVCYSEGASGFCTNQRRSSSTTTATAWALGWIADGVFANGTQIELTKVWSALAGYEHIWNPKWRTSVGGGYVNVDYNGDCDQPDPAAHSLGASAACGVAAASAWLSPSITLLPGNSCSPDYSFWEAGTRTQWNPVPQLDIGMEVLYPKRNTAFKGPATLRGERLASRRGSTRIIDDQNVWSAMFRWQRNFYP